MASARASPQLVKVGLAVQALLGILSARLHQQPGNPILQPYRLPHHQIAERSIRRSPRIASGAM